MKKTLWDSFEFREAATLFKDLLSEKELRQAAPDTLFKEEEDHKLETDWQIMGEKVPETDRSLDPLEQALERMCKRGSFQASVLADNSGLLLATYNSPVEGDIMAAFTSIMGESMAQAATLLRQPNANNISMDINYLDKIILRKFSIEDVPYFLLIISPQQVDERAEVELSITQISDILKVD
jgi:hypothetical protein